MDKRVLASILIVRNSSRHVRRETSHIFLVYPICSLVSALDSVKIQNELFTLEKYDFTKIIQLIFLAPCRELVFISDLCYIRWVFTEQHVSINVQLKSRNNDTGCKISDVSHQLFPYVPDMTDLRPIEEIFG